MKEYELERGMFHTFLSLKAKRDEAAARAGASLLAHMDFAEKMRDQVNESLREEHKLADEVIRHFGIDPESSITVNYENGTLRVE